LLLSLQIKREDLELVPIKMEVQREDLQFVPIKYSEKTTPVLTMEDIQMEGVPVAYCYCRL
jgi:hypothetical protein